MPRVGRRLSDSLRIDIDPNAARTVFLRRRDDDAAVAAAEVVDHIDRPDVGDFQHGIHDIGRGRNINNIRQPGRRLCLTPQCPSRSDGSD